MTTKEKLDLLWKYLLLMVLVYGFAQLGNSHSIRKFDHKFNHGSDKAVTMWMSDDNCDMEKMDINVEIEKMVGGDSTMVVTINGKEVDPKDFDMKVLGDGETEVFVKKMMGSGKSGTQTVKIITKEITDE